MSGLLFDVAVANARDEFEPRTPHVWAGDEGNRDLARMSRVAFLAVPELTARFEAEWPVLVGRIHGIGRVQVRPRLRIVA
jgi:hypothetical protein